MNITGKIVTTVSALLGIGVLGAEIDAQAENRIDAQRADAPSLSAYGNLPVGVRTLEMVNPQQVEILKIDPKGKKPETLPLYDRSLTVEIWYPAAAGVNGNTALKVFIRDGKTEVALQGKAVRDTAPTTGKNYPLVLVSHGYPGNRFLLSHLAENIASKGYVVASIDHTDSTYRTKAAFGSTLVNRPLDQLFVLEQMALLGADKTSFLNGVVDASNTALIGYSMGAYGAVITAGGGVTQKSIDYAWGGPFGTLGIHKSGSETHNQLPDPRIKTAIAFAPWGMNFGFWDGETLKGVKIPMMFVAGSQDDVSGYEKGTRAIWKAAVNVDRALLTIENANHNAGAPIPAPEEADKVDKDLGFNLTDHYNDAVWDTVRLNNISQHFVSAWLGKYLKADAAMDSFLELVPQSNNGVWSQEKDGVNKADHTHWKGFSKRTAKGLRFEKLTAGK